MTISITSTSIELTPALRDYTEKRFASIAKFAGGDATVSVELGKTSMHHKQGDYFRASVNVVTPLGKQHHAESDKADLYEAIDDVRDEIITELTKEKGRTDSLFKRGARRIKDIMRGFKN